MYFDANPPVAKRIVDKGLNAARAREAARKAREAVRKSALTGAVCPASWRIVPTATRKHRALHRRGDSAGGSAKQGRDRKFQATCPSAAAINVRGPARKVLQNNEIRTMITAIGTGHRRWRGEGAFDLAACGTTDQS